MRILLQIFHLQQPPLQQYAEEFEIKIPDDSRVELECLWPSYASHKAFNKSSHRRVLRRVGRDMTGINQHTIGYTEWSYNYSCHEVVEESITVYGPCGLLLNEKEQDLYKKAAIPLWLHEFEHVNIVIDFLDKLAKLVESTPCDQLDAKVYDAELEMEMRNYELDSFSDYD